MTEVTENKGAVPAQPPSQALASATPEVTKNPATEAKTIPAEHKRGNGSIIAIIALALAAGATLAGYSGWQQLKQKQTILEERLDNEEQMLSGLQSTSDSVKDNTQSLQQQLAVLESQLKEIQQHGSRVDESLAEINQRLEQRRGNDWLVAEARHLINIASHQAQLNHNTKAAIAALEAADQRLRDADEPSLLKARQALSNDISALRAVPSVDIAGIALLLGQLEQQVAGLPLASTDEEAPASAAAPAATEELSGLERFLHKVWNDLKSLVTIRHSSGPAGSPLTTPDQRLHLQQNLRLKLEVARLALLQRDTQTFRATIATIRQWLESYYDTKAATTAAMLTSLAPFATLELQPPLPDIGNALRALDGWQEQRKGHKVEAPLKREAATS